MRARMPLTQRLMDAQNRVGMALSVSPRTWTEKDLRSAWQDATTLLSECYGLMQESMMRLRTEELAQQGKRPEARKIELP